MKILKNVIILVVGVIIIYWAQAHSPEAGLGSIISNEISGSYTLDEPVYYLSLVAGAAIAIFGLIKTIKSFS